MENEAPLRQTTVRMPTGQLFGRVVCRNCEAMVSMIFTDPRRLGHCPTCHQRRLVPITPGVKENA